MKRVKETHFKEHPDWMLRQGVSGGRDFDGEDLDYESRKQYQLQQQKAWLDQKVAENEAKKQQELYEEKVYAQQTLELNRMRGMLEDDFLQKKKVIRETVKNENLSLAKQKKDKEYSQKMENLGEEKADVNETLLRGTKQQFQLTNQQY